MSRLSGNCPDLLIFDGACGTSLQCLDLPSSCREGHGDCNELLNLSRPDAVLGIHRAFLAAGADVVETNTFGANRLVLRDHGLHDRVAEINRAAVAHARRATAEHPGTLVCGSLGPGNKLPLLGQVGVDELAAAYAEQVAVLVEAGVDLLLFETCQDLLQIKTALAACLDTLERLGRHVPVMVSVTVEPAGTLLTGSDIGAVAAALAPFPLLALGLNCATGPREMAGHLRHLARHWPRRISAMPNAGLPRLEDGRTIYPLGPEDFAAGAARLVREEGATIIGGCCGATPEHVRALVRALRPPPGAAVRAHPPPARNKALPGPALASAYSAFPLRPGIPPFLIGERLNANGSKVFRDCLLAGDMAGALQIARRQEAAGAMALDLCVAYAGRDELADMIALVRLLRTGVRIPLMIDSTRPEVIEAALRLHPGRCIVNSVSLEDGGATFDRVCALARRHGAAVVALAIGRDGMAMTADDKVAVAREMLARAVTRHGLRAEDLLIDPLTFTVGSGDASLRTAAAETLAAIGRIKRELPGVGTVLGISNVSFGLPAAARRTLNSVFLHEAVAAGLDAAIVDVARIQPLHAIGETERRLCLDLLLDRAPAAEAPAATGGADAASPPLAAFLRHFGSRREKAEPEDEARREEEKTAGHPLEQRLAERIVNGATEGLEDLLDILLRRYSAAAIINTILVPAMRRTGHLFAAGETLLPFVLQSAEAMKHALAHLERFMAPGGRHEGPGVILATVQGDVHDIGKNLVGIILAGNGYTVHDLGIKVPAATIIAKARELQPMAIGLSGLLVRSTLVMKENLAQFREAGLKLPVLLGGAALTPGFVARECVPLCEAPVVYCADAFDGLRALREHEAGRLRPTTATLSPAARQAPPAGDAEAPRRDNPVPRPPFHGPRHLTGIALDDLLPHVNEQALFRWRWGYRRGRMSPAQHEALLRDEVRPLYESLLRQVREEGLLRAGVAYGYFRARAEGDSLLVEHEGREFRFDFPRQPYPPHRCIADFFKRADEGGDVAGFYVATIGDAFGRAAEALRTGGRYRDWLLMHGLGVELAEALAEHQHARMRRELGIGRPRSADGAEGAGVRYAFGFAACPGIEAHRTLFALLRPERIGVTLTETMQMAPGPSTSAIVVHHPQACYFAI
jgi:5-methyltetrahydrofolate--homocysteine methyltransferase